MNRLLYLRTISLNDNDDVTGWVAVVAPESGKVGPPTVLSGVIKSQDDPMVASACVLWDAYGAVSRVLNELDTIATEPLF